MPSVKMPKKSTVTDMTPFVDVAFLILFFFIMATKFKPPEPVEITTPKSVSSDKLKEQDAVQVEMDKLGRVFFDGECTEGVRRVEWIKKEPDSKCQSGKEPGICLKQK